MTCCFCQHEIENGLIRDGNAFCSVEHAEEYRRDTADAAARREGFWDAEDMAEHYGWTVIG